MQIKKGVKLLQDKPGNGKPVERNKYYKLSIRVTLNKGDVVVTPNQCLGYKNDENIKLQENGFFDHLVRIDRENLIAGIFYTVESMNVGDFSKVAISPHLAYGEKGIPELVPKNAKIIAEIYVLGGSENG